VPARDTRGMCRDVLVRMAGAGDGSGLCDADHGQAGAGLASGAQRVSASRRARASTC